MSLSTTVERRGERAVVVKRAAGADGDRLEQEGARLRAARHPGVVEVVRSAAVDGGWELVLSHAGRPLSALPGLSIEAAAGLAAALASTLADLHQLGVVHGRVDATHVLVGHQGRPVLCGFGGGPGGAQPDDDVAAVGALLTELVGSDAEMEPIPDRRWWGRRGWRGWERRALLLIADHACAEPATRRPSARRLAAAIAEAIPRASDRPVEPSEDDDIERLRASTSVPDERASVRPAAVGLAVAGVGLIVAGVIRFGGGAQHDEAVPLAAVVPTASTSVPPTITEPLSTGRAVEGSLVTAGGRRYRVGQPGDLILVEDWTCDGTPTLALLRPATDEVFLFPRWIEQGALAVEPVTRVAGARDLVSQLGPDGCPTLAVRTEGGSIVPVIGTGGA